MLICIHASFSRASFAGKGSIVMGLAARRKRSLSLSSAAILLLLIKPHFLHL